MKRIYQYAMMGLLGLAALTSCSEDLLETSPTTAVATNEMFGNTDRSISALNGIYRSFYTTGCTSGWTAEEFGYSAFVLTADLMGEDHIQQKSGSGWFWYDYQYDVKGDYTHTSGRPYGVWNFFYTTIANANYLIGAEETMAGETSDVNYIVGQGYALRALSYFMLSQWYARTLVGHENEPCVPIYTDQTDKKTPGQPRATVAAVYKQIDSDIAKAIALLKATTRERDDKSHFGLAEAYGLAARIAQVEEDWNAAKNYAVLAIEAAAAEGLGIAEVSQFPGLNDVSANNVMWGMHIKSDQSTMYSSFFCHMDADQGKYGFNARQQITRTLYALMGENDARRAWWNPKDKANGSNGYQQEKFKFKNYTTWEGDYIFMRVEEMYLVKAEAECMLGDDAAAQQTLAKLMAQRDPDYKCEKTGKALGVTSNEITGSLLEEIINQRRIELWGEFGRIYDLRRLHQGFIRTEEMGHTRTLSGRGSEDPESYIWVMVIPQSEFDGNATLDISKDQNPFD